MRRPAAARLRRPAPAPWTFLTNHAHVLLCLAADPGRTVEAVAREVGVTERSARRIIGELERAGYLEVERVGRNNRYRLVEARPLRHPIERHRTVAALIDMVHGRRAR